MCYEHLRFLLYKLGAAEAGDLRYGFLFVPTVYLLLLIVVDLPFFAFASILYLKLRFR